jgi:RNA polymerase sigma-70 factor (ECF subfamily)
VWAAIRRLPARQRGGFALRQLDGHSTNEVAAMLGIAAGSVKTHLFRAVHELRRAMGDER